VGATDLDVPVEIVEELVHLPPGAGRPPHFERRVLPDDPARDQEMGEIDDVIGVVVRDEDARPIIGTDTVLATSSGLVVASS
jgi:hypothetical protein